MALQYAISPLQTRKKKPEEISNAWKMARLSPL